MESVVLDQQTIKESGGGVEVALWSIWTSSQSEAAKQLLFGLARPDLARDEGGNERKEMKNKKNKKEKKKKKRKAWETLSQQRRSTTTVEMKNDAKPAKQWKNVNRTRLPEPV